MNSSQSSPTRQVWLTIFGALVLSVLGDCFIGLMVGWNPKTRTVNPANVALVRPYMIGAAIVMLVVSVVWIRFRVDGKIGGEGRQVTLSPQQFQTDSIVALALSEACTIFGLVLFFIGAPLREFLPFAIGTLFVDFAFILPRSLQFWANIDRPGNI